MNCLILGGNGFIGAHLCKKLLDERHTVKVLSKSKGFSSDFKYLDKYVSWINVDFSMVENFSEILKDIEYIFHFISTTQPNAANNDPLNDLITNVLPTVKLLEDIKRSPKVKKIIFLSSGGTVYGIPESIPIKESHFLNPIGAYGVHKVTIEKYLHFYFHNYDVDYSVLRLSNPYGIGQTGKNNQGVIPIFANKILNQQPIDIWGDGKIVRDFIYIKDVINAIYKVMTSCSENKVYNIGSGKGLSLLNVIETLSQITGLPYTVNFLEKRSFDVPENVLDITLASKNLSWNPSYSLEDGIKEMICEKGIEVFN